MLKRLIPAVFKSSAVSSTLITGVTHSDVILFIVINLLFPKTVNIPRCYIVQMCHTNLEHTRTPTPIPPPPQKVSIAESRPNGLPF